MLGEVSCCVWSEIMFYSFHHQSPRNMISNGISDNMPLQIKILHSYPLNVEGKSLIHSLLTSLLKLIYLYRCIINILNNWLKST